VLGAFMAPRVVARLPFGHAILVGPAMSVLASATMLATLLVPQAALALLGFIVQAAVIFASDVRMLKRLPLAA
jgi:hypothetical protein